MIDLQDSSKVAMYLKLKDMLTRKEEPKKQIVIKSKNIKISNKVSIASPIRRINFKTIDVNLLNQELGVDGRLDDSMISAVFEHRIYPEESA